MFESGLQSRLCAIGPITATENEVLGETGLDGANGRTQGVKRKERFLASYRSSRHLIEVTLVRNRQVRLPSVRDALACRSLDAG